MILLAHKSHPKQKAKLRDESAVNVYEKRAFYFQVEVGYVSYCKKEKEK